MVGLGPILLIALFGWHRLSGTGRRSLFLDIACICQNDAVRKARGIESLGALLDRSETMIVLMDETYFTRLWCAFEIFFSPWGQDCRSWLAAQTTATGSCPFTSSVGLFWSTDL